MLKKYLVIFLTLGLLLGWNSREIKADQCSNESVDKKVSCYEALLKETQGKQKTLSSTIAYFDNQISLKVAEIENTQAELKKLEEEIATLTAKINRIDVDLDDVSKLLVSRVSASYKRGYIQPVYLFLSSDGFSDFFSRNKYLQVAQQNDRKVLLELQNSRDSHQQQKDLKKQKQVEEEALQNQLSAQKSSLSSQKAGKQELLALTNNEEQKFQSLLATARAEMAAINSIIAGYGKETEQRHVNEGEKIASIIPGASACSNGTHLHFEVSNNNVTTNPASYLKNVDVDWDLCGWWGCDSTFAFLGSWNWPINGKPRITQGYGMTGYARTGAYNGGPHTGVDMVSSDLSVKAVKRGTLYKGSIACGGGKLTYVRVKHEGENIDTYYLHVY